MKEVIVLAACGANELLPQNPDLPADVFTACLTTPIKVPLSSGLVTLCAAYIWRYHGLLSSMQSSIA